MFRNKTGSKYVYDEYLNLNKLIWSGFNGLFPILMVLYYNNYNNITDSEIVQFVELFIQFSAVS